jgi:rRNA maturation protein Nop10
LFIIGTGAKRAFSLRMLRRTSSGSLYGNVDIFGKPTKTTGRKGIIPQHRLISKLRLNPTRKRYGLRTGAAQVRGGQVLLPIRNLGNTLDPLGGTFRLSGPSSRSGSFKAIAALPGKLVALGAGGARGMKKGRYTLTATVTQGGRRTNARTSFTIR